MTSQPVCAANFLNIFFDISNTYLSLGYRYLAYEPIRSQVFAPIFGEVEEGKRKAELMGQKIVYLLSEPFLAEWPW